VLVWPEGERPNSGNTILTDPCLAEGQAARLESVLNELGIGVADIRRIYVTHPHPDHMPNVGELTAGLVPLFGVVAKQLGLPAGISVAPCPGHHPMLASLVIPTATETTWIVGDAILDEEWLRAWGYFWPNGYSREEIVETWRSVAKILALADVVIPGHGPPFRVDGSLIDDLLRSFPEAECSPECPDVVQNLSRRIEQLAAD
jgi:glyoxylase-like metal-dependent hydrolase (beta-lactamase superfamily II)